MRNRLLYAPPEAAHSYPPRPARHRAAGAAICA